MTYRGAGNAPNCGLFGHDFTQWEDEGDNRQERFCKKCGYTDVIDSEYDKEQEKA